MREDKAVYIGEFANDAAATTYINSTQFQRDFGLKRATVTPFTGYFYKNTTIGGFRIYDGSAWVDLGAGTGGMLGGVVVVDKNGNDTEGNGSLLKPFLTVQEGVDNANLNDTVLIGPGLYPEILAITQSVNIQEFVKGTVTLQGDVLGGAVVTITPADDTIVRIDCNVVNIRDTGPGDIAVQVDNTGGAGFCLVYFRGELLDGGASGTALQVDGDAGLTEYTQVVLENVEDVHGGLLYGLQTALDLVRFNNVVFTGGLAVWMQITGAAGRVLIANSLLAAATNGETIDYGAGGACGVNLDIGSSAIAGTLNLNNNAGTGLAVITAGTQLGDVVGVLNNQILRTWLGENDILVRAYNVDVGAPVNVTMITPEAGHNLNPYEVRVINEGAATGAGVVFQFDGTGAASVVAAVGAAAVNPGVMNCVVVQDSIANPNGLDFNVTAGGNPGDVLQAEAVCRVF